MVGDRRASPRSVRIQNVGDPGIWQEYLRDEAGNAGHADAVVRLTGDTGLVAQVGSVLAYARGRRMPVTFSARRTSLTGAAIPLGGLLVLLPEASDPTTACVDREAQTATAPPWVLLADVQRAAAAAGLFLPPNPTSRDVCSLGGAIACNASGGRSYGYGPVGTWVEALTVVLASGDVLELRRGAHPPRDGAFQVPTSAGQLAVPCPAPRPEGLKSAVGYGVSASPDLVELFIGAEGTLGFVASATLRLIERPEVFSALMFWRDAEAALEFVARLQTAAPPGVRPMTIEWFDRRSLQLAGGRCAEPSVPESAAVALFVEQACGRGSQADVSEAWCEALAEAGGKNEPCATLVARTAAQRESLRAFRHAVPEAVNSLMRSRGLRKVGTDLAYPPGWLLPMMAVYDQALHDIPGWLGGDGAQWERTWRRRLPRQLDFAAWGHIGDNHLHVNLLPSDQAEASAAQLLHRALARHCAAVGGAISAEHGIGKSKRALVAELVSADRLAVWRAIKRGLDPEGLLAPGNIFEP